MDIIMVKKKDGIQKQQKFRKCQNIAVIVLMIFSIFLLKAS